MNLGERFQLVTPHDPSWTNKVVWNVSEDSEEDVHPRSFRVLGRADDGSGVLLEPVDAAGPSSFLVVGFDMADYHDTPLEAVQAGEAMLAQWVEGARRRLERRQDDYRRANERLLRVIALRVRLESAGEDPAAGD